jgi:hypothetical protein
MQLPKPFLHLAAAATLAALAGCADTLAPDATATRTPQAPAFLLGPDEGMRIISDTTDASGRTTMIAEYAAGVAFSSDPAVPSTSAASVTIKTVIPGSGPVSSSGACITSTIQTVETTAGWTYSVKKPGGCDKEIIVELEKKSTRQRATFSFLMVAGKTRIDSGLIR